MVKLTHFVKRYAQWPARSNIVGRARKENMKLILNVLMYLAQWLHLRMGGEIEVARNRLILIAPKGRHFRASDKETEARLKADESQATDA